MNHWDKLRLDLRSFFKSVSNVKEEMPDAYLIFRIVDSERDRHIDEANKNKSEAKDRAEYERLKAKFEPPAASKSDALEDPDEHAYWSGPAFQREGE